MECIIDSLHINYLNFKSFSQKNDKLLSNKTHHITIIVMVCLMGYVYTTVEDIRKVFGRSEGGDRVKTTTEWNKITIPGYEHKISLYDWIERQGDEEEDWEPQCPYGKYWWHVGGYDKDAVKAVAKAMMLDEADYCYE